jgi:hypothetical protein
MGKLSFCLSIAILVISLFMFVSKINAEIPEYSVTWINHFDTASDLGDCNIDANETVAWLGSRGYSNFFVWGDYDAWKIDFDIYNSGYEGLDEADFHLHSGHGGWGYVLLANGDTVHASDVSGHWDWDNEWVFLYTCLTLADHANWASAMTTGTHALFGFTSVSYGTNGALMDGLFRRAIQWGWTPVQAYYGATMDNSCYPDNSTCIFITDTYSQWYNDHMWFNDPGYSTDDDEYPDDNTYWYATWNTY